MLSLSRVGVFEERRAVELREAMRIFGKCPGTQSRSTPIPLAWHASMKALNSSGVPNRLVGAKKPMTWYPQDPENGCSMTGRSSMWVYPISLT